MLTLAPVASKSSRVVLSWQPYPRTIYGSIEFLQKNFLHVLAMFAKKIMYRVSMDAKKSTMGFYGCQERDEQNSFFTSTGKKKVENVSIDISGVNTY